MSAPDLIEYAYARCDRLKTLAQLRKAQKHADRVADARCVVRPGTNPSDDQVRWTLGQGDGAFDLIEGWRRAKGSARERAKAPICLHLIIGVSPSWVARAGNLHDRSNPANAALFAAARDFATREIGTVAAARLDLDEEGGGVVDVFVVPVFERQRRIRKDRTRSPDSVLEISANKAFEKLCEVTGEKGDYAALQTAWADHAQRHLDRRLKRGERKTKTKRHHLETPEFKELMRKTTKLKEEAEAAQAVLDQLPAERRELEDVRRSLDRREAWLVQYEEQYRSEIDREVKTLAAAWTRVADGEELTDADRASLAAPMAIKASAALEAAIAAVEAEKAAQATRTEEIIREEERVAGLRHAVEARQHELDEREEKVGNDEQAIRTRDAGSRTRAAELEKKESRLGIAEQEAQAASEHAAYLMEEARSLKGRIMGALEAVIRRWRGGSEPGDDEILKHKDVASLAEAAHLTLEEIDSKRRGLESMRQTVATEIERMHKLESQQADEASRLNDLKTDLDNKDKEITQKASELEARDVKLTKREKAHTDAVAKHDERVAADINRIGRFVLALRQRLIGAPLAEDQAILDDPMFDGIRVQVDETRKALDAEITAKRETRDKLANESTVLGRQSAKIKAVGPALAAWLAGERSDELQAKLGQPEAKPFVDAFDGLLAALAKRREIVDEKEQELEAKMKETRKEEAKAARRLVDTEKRASDLAELIEANAAEATRIGNALQRYGKAIDELAEYHNRASLLPRIEEAVADASSAATKAQQLRKPPVKGGFERD
ncbi:hypothetical protein [Rhabdaerophilum sp. SD176]|uniref:hypothetical protein n=1 Tax=Rhabdaerophilum sp. SD176 TaxID=2983548 RepID=UPI0024DF7C64|nr:hypothetical protein [Rhabdaerophilum sp. SD176]